MNLYLSFASLRRVSLAASFAVLLPVSPYAETGSGPASVVELPPYAVTGVVGSRRIDDLVQPTSVLTGDSLRAALTATLGEALDGIPGVQATSFGAGASRPVIRGFSGPRVRVLESGVDAFDASDTSPDHAVSIDPFFAGAIDVVRGPSTLLYGSSAVGGVVNVIDRRIARERPATARSGEARIACDSASEGWETGAVASIAAGNVALVFSGRLGEHGDYAIPGFAESARMRALEEAEEDHDYDEGEDHQEGEEEVLGVLPNSFSDSRSGSVALSWFPHEGTRLSVAWFGFESNYGVPGHSHRHAEEEHDHEGDAEHGVHEEDAEHGHDGEAGVAIDLTQRRIDFDLEHDVGAGVIESLRFRANLTDYRHFELEGEAVGTRFDRDGWEARLDLTHRILEESPGVVGIQAKRDDFVAAGEEAFVPPATTEDLAVFALQEWRFPGWRLETGARAERRTIGIPTGRGYDDWGLSLSAGAVIPRENWTFSLALSRSERHPTTTELFADGPHAATGQFEMGDALLKSEEAIGFDGSVRYDSDRWNLRMTLFATDFDGYLYGEPTGEVEDDLPVYRFRATDARFYGAEMEATWHLLHGEDRSLHLEFGWDYVRAERDGNDGALPRIPPMRGFVAANFHQGTAFLSARVTRAGGQDRVFPGELATDGYTDVRVYASYGIELTGNVTAEGFVRLDNLLDKEIRHHTSSIKDLAPQPGRNVTVGMRLAF